MQPNVESDSTGSYTRASDVQRVSALCGPRRRRAIAIVGAASVAVAVSLTAWFLAAAGGSSPAAGGSSPASCDDPAQSKGATCASFVPLSNCSTEQWQGKLRDLFSPDDTCPRSTRYVDVRDGALEVSASNTDAECNSTWGRRFDPHTSVDPVIVGSGCSRQVSFLSKVPSSTPEHALAERGALNFTLTLGTACGRKVLRWNGVYDGQGGEWPPGHTSGPTACDNFWLFDDPSVFAAVAPTPILTIHPVPGG